MVLGRRANKRRSGDERPLQPEGPDPMMPQGLLGTFGSGGSCVGSGMTPSRAGPVSAMGGIIAVKRDHDNPPAVPEHPVCSSIAR